MPTTLAKNLRSDRIDRLRLRRVYAVAPATPVARAVQEMAEQRVGCALVTDAAGALLGIFTERDFLTRVIAAGVATSVSVDQVMTPSPRTVGFRDSVFDAVEAMNSGGYRHLPVVDGGGRAVGVLSVKDVVHYLVEYFPAQVYNLPPTHDQAAGAREGA